MNPILTNSTLTENNINPVRVLVVSRDAAVLRALGPMEASQAWQVERAANGWEAMERMQSGSASDLLLLDVPLKDDEAMHFLRWLSCFRPDFPVVLLSCPEDARRVREATGLGVNDIVLKPFDAQHLDAAIRKHLGVAGNGSADSASKNTNTNIEGLGEDKCFVSASLIMQKLRSQAALLAKTDVPVLIVGERGAGKYTVATLIHQLSVRSGFPLHRVNCAAMPEAVLEAELFGDDRGGRQTSRGKFGPGEKGTILLEEIAEMPAGVQFRLLQVLQNHEVRNAAASPAATSVRILASSSAQLERALAEKQLREDLYHRLSAFTLQVPALRKRKEEMGTLLRYFMHNLARHYGLPPRGFSSIMVAACQHYSWPGNLKELETLVKRYLVAGDQDAIFSEIGADANGGVDHEPTPRSLKVDEIPEQEIIAEPTAPPVESLKSLIQGVKVEAERGAIGAALMRTGWNRKAAARLLKVSYRTLLYKIEQYKMRAPQPYLNLTPLPAGEFSGYEAGKRDRDRELTGFEKRS
jgi:DNA-binding NtrC family response regulator